MLLRHHFNVKHEYKRLLPFGLLKMVRWRTLKDRRRSFDLRWKDC